MFSVGSSLISTIFLHFKQQSCASSDFRFLIRAQNLCFLKIFLKIKFLSFEIQTRKPNAKKQSPAKKQVRIKYNARKDLG